MTDNRTLSMFNEDIYDALRDCVKACGGFKKVGHDLFPEKPIDKASEYLSSCLDRNRPEKLSLEHILKILLMARKAECHIGIDYICEACDYKTPEPLVREEKLARAGEEIDHTIQKLEGLLDKYKAIKGEE